MSTLLAIGAHHDDVEIRAGGTLTKYVQRGWDVVYAIACTTPYYFPTPEQTATNSFLDNRSVIALRKAEATKAAGILGIASRNIHFFDFKSLYWYKDGTHDLQYLDGVNNTSADLAGNLEQGIDGRGYIVSAHRCRQEVDFLADFIGRHGADAVLTHHPDDGHWEHYAVCRLVFQALLELRGKGRKISGFCWAPGGAMPLVGTFGPTHFEDISSTIDIKCESLLCFPSQFADHDPAPVAARARAQASAYGRIAGMAFAEGFMPLNLDCQCSGLSEDILLPSMYVPQNVRTTLTGI